MRRLPLVLGWLALLAMVLIAVLYEPAPTHTRTDTTRWRVSPIDSPVAFPLDPDEEAIKLVTWLAAPARWARDVRSWSTVRLELTVTDPQDRVVWSGESWRRTRSSWIRRPDGALLRAAWLPQSRLEVSDSRVSIIDVTGLVPDGGSLSVRAVSPTPGATVMTAAYRHGWRTRAARLRVLAGAGGRRTDTPAARITSEGWETLPEAWQGRLAERLWERISPLPAPGGRAQQTQPLLTAQPDQPWEAQPALGLPVPPGGAVAYNIRRGGVLRAEWRDLSGRRASAAPTWLQLVYADGTSEVSFLGVVREIGPIVVDQPLQSIQLALDPTTEGPRIVQARMGGGSTEQLWGSPPVARLVDEDEWLVAPDLRSLELVRVSPELGPVRFAVSREGELLRLSLRPRLGPGSLPAFGLVWDPATNTTTELSPETHPAVVVTVVARDADDQELTTWQTTVEITPTPFERFSQADDPGTARCSEPETRILVPPAGTATIELSASAPIDVGARAHDPSNPPAGLARGYELPEELAPPIAPIRAERLPVWSAGRNRASRGFTVARYEPYSQDPWRSRAPLEREALLAADRVVRLDAQVRFEPTGGFMAEQAWMSEEPITADALGGAGAAGAGATDPGRSGPQPRHALSLSGPYELVVEPDRDGRSSAGGRTLITETPARVEVSASGRLDIDYRVQEAGGQVELSVDGVPTRRRLLASAGRLRLADLSPGSHQVAVDGSGLFLARASGSRPWEVRRVVRLDPGETWRITVPGGPNSVALYTYGEGGWLEWRLTGGSEPEAPAIMDWATRRFGRHRLHQEGGQARALSFGAESLARLSPLVVSVGTDVGTAPLQLEATLTGAQAPVWLRATATWARPRGTSTGRTLVVDR